MAAFYDALTEIIIHFHDRFIESECQRYQRAADRAWFALVEGDSNG